MSTDPLRANRTMWDEFARLHAALTDGDYYDLPRFKAGASTLKPPELAEVGDVAGKSLLHLQCHIGLDTLSWARLGARVTGIDFSAEAIRQAREIAHAIDQPAEFSQADLYAVPDALAGRQFDHVFTSYGALCWLPDITGWAQVVAQMLRPGGVFYIIEFHPFMFAWKIDKAGETWRTEPGYFSAGPLTYTDAGSYAAASDTVHTSYEWLHGLGAIVTALCKAGLRIEFLHEFPYSSYQLWSILERRADGLWWPREGMGELPLMFSIRAIR